MTDLTPKTAEDALTLALKLVIQAPTEGQKKECIALAVHIAKSMTAKQVDICKAAAYAATKYEETYQ